MSCSEHSKVGFEFFSRKHLFFKKVFKWLFGITTPAFWFVLFLFYFTVFHYPKIQKESVGLTYILIDRNLSIFNEIADVSYKCFGDNLKEEFIVSSSWDSFSGNVFFLLYHLLQWIIFSSMVIVYKSISNFIFSTWLVIEFYIITHHASFGELHLLDVSPTPIQSKRCSPYM